MIEQEITEDYSDILKEFGVPFQNTGVWLQCGEVQREHGWKLHLSSVQIEVGRVLHTVIPILLKANVPFKIVSNTENHTLLNEGLLGVSQIGKFCTIYFEEIPVENQKKLVAELISKTSSYIGPRIPSDAHLGSIVYCRYGEYRPRKVRNRLGLFESDVENRSLVKYTIPFQLSENVPRPKAFNIPEVDDKQKTISLVDYGFLPISVLKSHPKGSILKAIDLRDQTSVRSVVLKKGRAWTMSDKYGRHIKDRFLNHHNTVEKIIQKVNTPISGPLLEFNKDYYLVNEFIEGYDFDSYLGTAYRDRKNEDQIDLLAKIKKAAEEISKLHGLGYAHRDITPSNIRIGTNGKVYLIDFELAYNIENSNVPFEQGTVGYVSPQQYSKSIPDFSDDIYSFGATIASVLSGFPGHLIPKFHEDLSNCLYRLTGAFKELCDIVAQMLHTQSEIRPSIEEVIETLSKDSAVVLSKKPIKQRTYTAIINSSVEWILNGAKRDINNNMWVSPNLESNHSAGSASIAEFNVYRSANKGVAGIVYTLSKLCRQNIINKSKISNHIEESIDWLLLHKESPDDQMPGLHFGEAGVAVAISEAISSGIIKEGEWTKSYFDEVFNVDPDWPDLTHGAAGQGLSTLICGLLLKDEKIIETSDYFAEYLVKSQEKDGSWILPSGVAEMENKKYTGFAHGVAGVVYFLICHSQSRNKKKSYSAAIKGIDWLMGEAQPNSNTSIKWPLEAGSNESWNWWCHGAPGIGLTFLAMYELTKEVEYEGAARACLRSYPINRRFNNLSQCHGLAGIGEIFIEGYRVLKDPELLVKANVIASILADLGQYSKSGVSWKVENIYFPEVDLMTGCSGIVHFLSRLNLANQGKIFSMPLLLPTG